MMRQDVLYHFHTIKSILNSERMKAGRLIEAYFHTIKSILNPFYHLIFI